MEIFVKLPPYSLFARTGGLRPLRVRVCHQFRVFIVITCKNNKTRQVQVDARHYFAFYCYCMKCC